MARPKKIQAPTVAEAPAVAPTPTIVKLPALTSRYRRGRANFLATLTARKLTQYLDGFRNGDLRGAAGLWELMTERDGMLLNCRSQREKQVSRLSWSIVATDRGAEGTAPFRAQRDFLTAFYNGIKAVDAFDRNKKGGLRLFLRQLMTAESVGYSAHHLTWSPRPDGHLGLTVEHVPLRFFENVSGELRFCPTGMELEGQEMPPEAWLVHTGEALMTAASVLIYFKREGMGAFVQFVEKFGIPFLHAKTDAAKGSAEWDGFVEMLGAFYNDGAVVTGLKGEIKAIETGNTGQSPHERLIDLCDRGLAILFRGGDLATLSNQKSHAGQGADLQQTSGQALLEDDAANVEDCLARLTEMALRWRFGPAAPVLATFELVIPSPTEDAERLKNASQLKNMGAQIDPDELAREMDFEVSEPTQSAADPSTGQPPEPPPADHGQATPTTTATTATAANERPDRRASFLIDAVALLRGARLEDLQEVAVTVEAMARLESVPEIVTAWNSLSARLPDILAKTDSQQRTLADLLATCVANGADGQF